MDFGEIFRQFDTALMGRGCYEFMLREGRSPRELGMKSLWPLQRWSKPSIVISLSSDRGWPQL
jgi:hypothetical protein